MTGPASDHDLFIRFAAGEVDALGLLADRYEIRLLGLARGLLGGSCVLAEEAVQESWVKVIRSAAAFEGRSEIWTWLYRITVNTCRDIARREKTRRKHASPAANEMNSAGGESTGVFDEEVRSAVRALLIDQREALMLSAHAELTDEQAATVLAIPLGTYKSRVRAAKTAMRRALTAEVQA